MNLLQKIERDQVAKMSETSKIPAFSPGDTLKVNVKVVEGTRERIQAFEGRVHRAQERGHQFVLHRAQDQLQ